MAQALKSYDALTGLRRVFQVKHHKEESAQEELNVIVLRSVFTTSPTPFALHHPVQRPPTPAAPLFHHLDSSSLCICALVCGLLFLDVLAVVDGDPAAGGEPDPVDEGDGDESDDEEGDDYEDGFHAVRRRGVG